VGKRAGGEEKGVDRGGLIKSKIKETARTLKLILISNRL
jgi:hypothetical protein